MASLVNNYETSFRLLSFLTYDNTKVHPVLLLLTSLSIQLTVGYRLCLCLHHDMSLVLRDDLFIYLDAPPISKEGVVFTVSYTALCDALVQHDIAMTLACKGLELRATLIQRKT